MNSILFNIHDVALLLRVGECAMLALLFLAHRGAKPASHFLLAAFLLLNAMIALHTLILWGDAVRFTLFDLSPNIFFSLAFAHFLQGPIIYWYTLSLLYRDFKFTRTDLLHLLPTLLTPIYLYFVYYRHTLEKKKGLALDFANYGAYDWNFNWFVHAEKTIVVVYGATSLYQVLRYRRLLKQRYSSVENIDLTWLLLLIGGFLFAWAWILLTHVIGLNHFFHISKVMAIAGNYLIFVLVNVLIFYSLLYSNVFEGISARQGEREITNEAIPPDHIERIRNAMERDKLFLNTRLTLDEFAKRVELPSRQVSAAINQCLQQNFHEFVNRYRVEEAKRILSLPDKERQTVVQISSMSGFNSKAAFNRFFKKFAGMTPSQFRDQHQTTHAPQNKGSSIN